MHIFPNLLQVSSLQENNKKEFRKQSLYAVICFYETLTDAITVFFVSPNTDRWHYCVLCFSKQWQMALLQQWARYFS